MREQAVGYTCAFVRERDFAFLSGPQDTGYGISHFARHPGTIPDPVKSREKNPGEGPGYFRVYSKTFENSTRVFMGVCSSSHQSNQQDPIRYNEDTQLVIRAIGVSHTACKDEFRRNLRFHSWSVFSFFIIIPGLSRSYLNTLTIGPPGKVGRPYGLVVTVECCHL